MRWFFVGCLLSGLYFGGLWLTLVGLERSKNPQARVKRSFILRSVFLIASLLMLDIQALIPGMAGFLLVRNCWTAKWS